MARLEWHDGETASGIGGWAPCPAMKGRAALRNARSAHTKRPARFIDLIAHWCERARQRAALARLDARMLRDVGLTHEDARRESEKPFWR